MINSRAITPNACRMTDDVFEYGQQVKHIDHLFEGGSRVLSSNERLYKALGHIIKALKGETKDPDTGKHPLAHADAQIRLALEAVLEKDGIVDE